MIFKISFLIFFTSTVHGKTIFETKASHNCGYKSCHSIKEGYINIHIVPHTHDDVGWLKTVDQYYYGSKSNYQFAGVQYILDTVVDSLRKNKNRRFIFVETAFFWKWWIKQHDITKSRVRKLVNNGQLEFISGGWSMNDEATTHYQSIIDQMTWGLRKLNDTFGECGRPKIGWQIDPFGHSREMVNIFAELGFDGVLLGRIDYQDKKYRFQTRTAEMVWRGSDSLGESSDIFTGVMYNTYSPPPGFCWDIGCDDEPIIDDKKSFEYNVDQRVNDFLAYVKNASKVYDTNNIIVTMGEDFNYQDAEAWFINLDKLIQYVNERQVNGSKYNLIYSTPSCYIKAIYDENKNKNWLLKSDDFFPYASDSHALWTGYFTSRPTIKRFERIGNNFLQVCQQLYALADLDPQDRVDLNFLREAMGVMQHHDAITGTERQHVANDYARHLQQGIKECEIITSAAIRKLGLKTSNLDENKLDSTLPLLTCPLVNISQCVYTENAEQFAITVYNPLSRNVSKVVKLPVSGTAYVVNDGKNNVVTQIMPIPQFIRNIPGRESNATNELIFIAENIPPLGWKAYFVKKTKGNHVTHSDNKLQNVNIKGTEFMFDPATGLIRQIFLNGLTLPLSQNFYIYNGAVGDNEKAENRSSGAYIFRPVGPSKVVADKVKVEIYRGQLVAEIHQTFNDYIHQMIRVNSIDNYIEFDWVVGPIPIDGPNGIEVTTKYSSMVASHSTFFTDSNGKQMLKRVRNFRPTWKVDIFEPISGNYYPVTSKIAIRDAEKGVELAVLTDRAQGGTSLEDGEIELMVHRNCLHDDAFGVGEALNETAFGKGLVVRGSHYLTFGDLRDGRISTIEKDIAQRRLLDSWNFITPIVNQSIEEFSSMFLFEYSGLTSALPKNVQILTLEPWIGFSFLLRLEHVFDNDEDPILSKSVLVNLKDLFTPFEIISVEETTLGANQWLKDNNRLKFHVNETLEELLYRDQNVKQEYLRVASQPLFVQEDVSKNEVKRETLVDAEEDDSLEIILNPSQIRTFIIHIKNK